MGSDSMAFNHSWQAALHPGETDEFFMSDYPPEFVANADSFNPINAWWLSELSRLIYKRDQTEDVTSGLSRTHHLDRVGLRESHFFNRPGIQAAIVESEGSDQGAFAVLVFRGTAGRMANWRFNFDIATCPWPAGGRVHRGFGHLIRQIWPPIAAALESIEKPLYFTGHSLGGALATLAASLSAPQAVYTFGAPRIGDCAFSRALSGVDLFNVINPHDFVTRLPPARLGFCFVHAGTIINNEELCRDYRPFFQAPNFLAGHAPLNYTAQLPVAFEN